MKIIGIIAEYNPFHNGHLYHIQKIKELYPDSLIILVLNGYFLQRGEMSIISKKDKTLIALENNIDLVMELPFFYGSQSADVFANVSLTILNYLKCDILITGSECHDITKINALAKKEINNEEYDSLVKEYLKKGINYPTALAKALKTDFTFLPNDLLNISYAKAIFKNNFQIKFETIKRTNNYHDLLSNDNIISASNIREKIKNKQDITNYLPTLSQEKIKTINDDNYFKLLKYQIINSNHLENYLDVDEGIEYRLKKYINEVSTLDELIKVIKTKRYTYNKIKRMFTHILTNLTKEDNLNNTLDYLYPLGFNKKGQKYLQQIKKELPLPLKRKTNSLIYEYELKASLIYDLINNTNTYQEELKNKPIIKN